MTIKTEPLTCELQVPADRQGQIAKLIQRWDASVPAAIAAEEEFMDGMRQKLRDAISIVSNFIHAENEDEEDSEDDFEDALDPEEAWLDWLDNRPVMQASHKVQLLPVSDSDGKTTCIIVKPRDDKDDDWDSTLAALQYVADELKLEQPIQMTWAHHDKRHGGDCRHFAIIQAGCPAVVEIDAVNTPGRLPTVVDPDDVQRSGWCVLKVPAGKERLAGELWLAWRKMIRDKKSQGVRIAAGVEADPDDTLMARLYSHVSGAVAVPHDSDGNLPDITSGTAVASMLIGQSAELVPSVLASCMQFFVDMLEIKEPLRCGWIQWMEDEDPSYYTGGAVVVRYREEPLYIDMDQAVAVLGRGKPKVTIYHGQVEPTVNVEHPELVDVEISDIADRDMLIVSHNGYLIYQAIKDASSNGEYFPSDWHVAPAPWRDIDDEEVFDLRDLPKLTDTQTRDYAATYPDDSPDAISLRYAIDTDQLPIDISEYRYIEVYED